jgi:hypothetical protein
MAKTPGERPHSAAEFVRLMRHAVAHPDDSIRPESAVGSADPTLLRGATVVAARPEAPAQPSAWPWVLSAVLALVLCIGGLAITLGGGAAAFVLGGENTPLPTAPKLPTPTPTLRPTATPEGQLLFDDFSIPASGFAVTRQDDPDGIVAYSEGALQITALTKGLEWFSPSGKVGADDVAIEATVEQVSGPVKNEMALTCRWTDQNNYTAFAINGEGSYSIWEQQAGVRKFLVDWTPGASIAPGAGVAHQLRATCRGSSLQFEVDGVLIGRAIDSDPGSGDVAVMAGMLEEGQLVVRFDDVRVRMP